MIQIYREMSFATYLDIAAGNHTVAYLLRGGDNTIYTKPNQSKWNGWYMENERTGEKDMQRRWRHPLYLNFECAYVCTHLCMCVSVWVRLCCSICGIREEIISEHRFGSTASIYLLFICWSIYPPSLLQRSSCPHMCCLHSPNRSSSISVKG